MQPPSAPAAAGNDKTTLYGVLGIIIGLICCGPVGIVLGYLSIQEAKKSGKSNGLGIAAIVISVIGLIWNVAVSINRFSA